MEMTLLRLLILTSLLCSSTNQVRLVVNTNNHQLFEGTPVTLTCVVEDGAEGWTVKRNTTKRLSWCGKGWGKWRSSSCTIEYIFQQDTGVYWCESIEGNTSSRIQLSITGGSVILQSPVLPVMEGDNVTLSCQTKTTPSNLPAAFYKDGVFFGNETSGNITVHRVSRTHEGLYRCKISGHGESPSSWISVEAKPPVTSSVSRAPPSASGPLQLVYDVVRHLVVFCPYFVSTIIMVSLYQPRPTENNLTVSVESSPPTESEQGTDVKIEVPAKN